MFISRTINDQVNRSRGRVLHLIYNDFESKYKNFFLKVSIYYLSSEHSKPFRWNIAEICNALPGISESMHRTISCRRTSLWHCQDNHSFLYHLPIVRLMNRNTKSTGITFSTNCYQGHNWMSDSSMCIICRMSVFFKTIFIV